MATKGKAWGPDVTRREDWPYRSDTEVAGGLSPESHGLGGGADPPRTPVSRKQEVPGDLGTARTGG